MSVGNAIYSSNLDFQLNFYKINEKKPGGYFKTENVKYAQRGQLKNSKVFISIVLNNDLQTLGPKMRLKKVPGGRAGKMVTYQRRQFTFSQSVCHTLRVMFFFKH